MVKKINVLLGVLCIKGKNSYFRYRTFENTGAGAEFGNFALAKLANERRAGALEYVVADVTFSYCINF